ncbi:trypsin-like protease, partial [Basidiobolus meristosporus CBS 931.73]
VLTAAHCAFNYSSTETFFDAPVAQPADTRVAIGSLSSSDRSLVGVKRIVIHPNYDSLTFMNDLALIELERPLRISSSIQPITISNSTLSPGQEVTAAGWGQTENQPSSSILLQVHLKISNVDLCRAERPSFIDNDGPQLCTGQTPGHDTCPGDSGGPL